MTEAEFRRSIPRYTSWTDYYPFYIGMKLEHDGRLAEAILAYREGLEGTGPFSEWLAPQAQLKVGAVHRKAGDLQKALSAYRQVIAKWPDVRHACQAAREAISEIEAEAKARDK